MKVQVRKILAAKILLATIIGTGTLPVAEAGIPVIDGGNLAQNMMSAMEAVQQTAKQPNRYCNTRHSYSSMRICCKTRWHRRSISGHRHRRRYRVSRR